MKKGGQLMVNGFVSLSPAHWNHCLLACPAEHQCCVVIVAVSVDHCGVLKLHVAVGVHAVGLSLGFAFFSGVVESKWKGTEERRNSIKRRMVCSIKAFSLGGSKRNRKQTQKESRGMLGVFISRHFHLASQGAARHLTNVLINSIPCVHLLG